MSRGKKKNQKLFLISSKYVIIFNHMRLVNPIRELTLSVMPFVRKIRIDQRVIKSVVAGAFIFCIGINLYLRLFPAYFPQYKKQAEITVKNRYLEDIDKVMEQLYSDYNPYAKLTLRKELLKTRLEDKEKFRQEVSAEYDKLKSRFQNEKGQTYLLELDPYHWMRYTENVLKNNYPGDKKAEGRNYDTYMLAPLGSSVCRQQFLFYLSAYLYKAAGFFYKGIPLERFLFYLPLFYAAILLVILYFFTNNIFSHRAAFFTVLFAGLNAMFIQRSCAGWFDSDSLSLIMPLLIVWFILLALKQGNSLKKIILFALFASFLQSIYVVVWTGWWFIFLVIAGFYGCSILNNYLIHQEDFKKGSKENLKYLVSGSIFIIGIILWGFLITKENLIYRIFLCVKENLHLGKSLSQSIWPNTYYTVGELMSSNLSKIADYLYGEIIFLLALISMFWLFIKERRGQRKDFFYIMFFWCVFMVFAALKSVRFTIFLSLPLGIFWGGFIDNLFQITKKFSSNRKLKLAVPAGVILLCAFFLSAALTSSYNSINYVHPLMDDSWHTALEHIKNNTAQEAIVNSWWDYGDFFKTAADRRVIFDGQSQNTPIAYWMAKVLLADDEARALRTLRMLNNGSNRTFGILNNYISSQYDCLVSLEKLLSMPREEAERFLLNRGVGGKDREKIISDLYNEPAEAVFVVDESMLNKMHSISFLGNWDFKKLYLYRHMGVPQEEVIGNLINIFALTKEEAQRCYEEVVITPPGKSIYEAISKRYIFYGPFMEGDKKSGLVCFDNGLVYDPETKQGIVYSLFNKKYKAVKNMFISDNGQEEGIKNKEGDFDKGIFLVKSGDKYKSIVLDNELIGSMFSRMYLLEGRGLKFFELFYKDVEAKIYIYKIKWD